MINYLKLVYNYINTLKVQLYTLLVCLRYGLKFDKTWRFVGKPIIHRPYIIHKTRKTAIQIGSHLQLNSKFDSNSIGLVQPVFFNARGKDSQIIIGNNVGISGSTLSAAKLIRIGNNVLIGSGCLIMDNDAHNISPKLRFEKLVEGSIKPVIIEDNVFIGSRSIILKGVTIGEGSVIGAGSIVSKDVPKNVIVAGNPARIIKNI
jgi:acetyltransferase-like isoleucine patch superfamily enzyme